MRALVQMLVVAASSVKTEGVVVVVGTLGKCSCRADGPAVQVYTAALLAYDAVGIVPIVLG